MPTTAPLAHPLRSPACVFSAVSFAVSLCALLVLAPPAATAQEDTTVRASPHAVKLQRIWMRRGSNRGLREVGQQVASMGDLNKDGLADFAVERKDTLEIFYGASPFPSDTPSVIIPNTVANMSSSFQPLLGDHWGTGYRAIGLVHATDFVLYRTESGRLADTPSVRLPRLSDNGDETALNYATAADLDADGYDELIVGSGSRRRNGQVDYHTEIMIYRGGPDFSLDEPAVILRDFEPNDGRSFVIVEAGDFDADSLLDLVFFTRYRDQGSKFKIYFGSGSLSGFGPSPDRTALNASLDFKVADVDGDGGTDIFIEPGLLFRSAAGKDARTRSFAPDDADASLLGDGYRIAVLGPLNDSSTRFSMIAKEVGILHAFSGSARGPDSAFDAYYAGTMDGLIVDDWARASAPLGDVNGDGWHDVIFGSSFYPSSTLKYGVALILTGGAYIPRDSLPLSAIRDIAKGGHHDAFTLWPLPATDVVNVAWRGDLPRAPRSFTVHDMLGRLISRGEIGPGASSIVWRCDDAAPGVYLIALFDASHAVLVSERISRR